MQNLFTNSFFRKQKKNLKAELGISDEQLGVYREIVRKRIDYVLNFDPDKDSEEKDWSDFERDVFRDLLGYAIKGDSPDDYNVFRQQRIRGAGRGGGTGKADCALGFYSRGKRADSDDVVIVEYKAPNTVGLGGEPTDQLWGYLEHHPAAKWGIVTNFNEIVLYHVSERRLKRQRFFFVVPEDSKDRKPSLADESELLRFLAIFRKDRLLAKEGKSLTEQMLEAQGIEEKKIEKEFYARYCKLRKELAAEIAANNPEYGKNRDELVSVTQKILDRLVFVWFCQDSREELLPRNILQRLISSRMQTDPALRPANDIWDMIKKLFGAIDKGGSFNIRCGYNGELFKPDPRIDALIIPNRIFENQIRKIGEEYDFGHENELSVNILGHIFEQSVTDLEEMRREETDEKIPGTGRRKREGIFYTPEYITRYIVAEAVGGWLADKRKELGENELPEINEKIIRKAVKEKWISKKTGLTAKPRLTKKVLTELEKAIGDENVSKKLDMLRNINCKNKAEFGETLSAFGELVPWLDTIVAAAMPKNENGREIWQAHLKFWSEYQISLRNIKVLDPACGSGAFLVQAFDMLYSEGQRVNDRLAELTDDGNGGKQKQVFDLDRHILENNLFGVDINSESVEITKLSLWLKTADKEKKLNNLSDNIKCGNSLVDVRKVAGKKAFRWEKEFPEIMKNGGFDVVIGNPPYFNVQTLGAGSPYAAYLQKKYADIWMDKSDILFYFIRKATELSKSKICFIVSNAFLFSDKAQKLRNHIIDNAPIISIVNFEQFMVFQDASITSAIVCLDKNAENSLTKAIILKEKSYSDEEVSRIISEKENVMRVTLKKDSVFALIDDKMDLLNRKIDGKGKNLGDMCLVGKGMETAADDIFTFKEYPGQFPSEFVRKRVTGLNTERYSIYGETDYILYFEDVENFEDLPESIQRYLLENKEVLENRADKKRRKTAKWWNYTFSMHKEYYHLPKLFCSRRSFHNTFSFDSGFEFLSFSNMTVIFETHQDISIKYVLTLLNSKLLNFRYKSIGKQTGGGSFEYFPNGVGKLPIPVISQSQQKPFVEKADQMLRLNKELAEAKDDLFGYLRHNFHLKKFSKRLSEPENQTFGDYTAELKKNGVPTEKKAVYDSVKAYFETIFELKNDMDKTDKEIDRMVCRLYNLTEEEIRIVEEVAG